MSPELSTAIRERLTQGLTSAAVATELVSAGYTPENANAAIVNVQSDLGLLAAVTPPRLIGVRELLKGAWRLMLEEWPIWLKSFTCFIFSIAAVIFLLFIFSGQQLFQQFSWEVAWLMMLFAPVAFLLLAALSIFLNYTVWRALLARRQQLLFRTHMRATLTAFFSLLSVAILVAIATQIGYILLIIPGLLAQIFFWFAIPLTVLGRTRGTSSLRLSFDLVKAHFAPVLGRLAVGLLIATFFVVLLVVPAIFGLAVFNQLELVSLTIILLMLLVGSLIHFWLTCLSTLLLESLLARYDAGVR